MITSNPWRLHVLLLILIGFQVLLAGALREDDERLEQDRSQGTTQARLDALHVMLAKGEPAPERFGQAFASQLLASEEAHIRDFAFTNDVCRIADAEAQIRWLAQNMQDPLTPDWIRAFMLQFRKVGGRTTRASLRMNRQEFVWLMSEREIAQDVFLEHLRTYNRLAYEHLLSYR